jgi:hypothetical protein
MALNNFARTYLRMEYYKYARQYLYPALNHASPFVTWCEERGVEKNTSRTSGDRQHLWTPLSVLQYITDAFFFENNDCLYLFTGIYPEWFNEKSEIKVENLNTPYGKTSLVISKTKKGYKFNIKAEKEISKKLHVHYFSPQNEDKMQVFEICSNNFTAILD